MSPNDLGTTGSGTTIKESVQRLADQGGETAHVLKDRASDAADQLKRSYSAAISWTVDFVHARPLAAVGVAVGLGYLSRTLFRIGMIAGTGLLLARIVPMVSGARDKGERVTPGA